MSELGTSMNDLTGWREVACAEADEARAAQPVHVASALTDIDGNYGRPVMYTEWAAQADERPVLRDYLHAPHSANAKCEHYVPATPKDGE